MAGNNKDNEGNKRHVICFTISPWCWAYLQAALIFPPTEDLPLEEHPFSQLQSPSVGCQDLEVIL